MSRLRLVVGISGASGAAYGKRCLERIRMLDIESHLVISKSARLTIDHEIDGGVDAVRGLADQVYSPGDIGAACSSGSFRTLGMIVAPCSVRSLAEIANGVTSGLLTRAAEVTLKERRRLVLMVRETPLTLSHIRNMEQVTQMGAVVMPPVPALYAKPKSIDEMVDYSVARALDLFDLPIDDIPRWSGL